MIIFPRSSLPPVAGRTFGTFVCALATWATLFPEQSLTEHPSPSLLPSERSVLGDSGVGAGVTSGIAVGLAEIVASGVVLGTGDIVGNDVA